MEIIDYLLARKKAGGGSDVTIEQLSVTENGTYSEQGIAYSPVVVNVPAPENSYQLTDIPAGTVSTIEDGTDLPMSSLKVGIEPVQDLHGYDHPWTGGAGKNLLQNTATTQTINGVTFTVNDDGTVVANGTATQDISLQLSRKNVNDTPLPEGQLIMTGCPSGGSTSSYYLTCWRTNSGNANDIGNGVSFGYQSNWDFVVALEIKSGTTCNNLTFEPMIRLATETDPTYEPYSNICPISGWTAANVARTGKNLLNDIFLDWKDMSPYLILDGKLPSNREMIMSFTDKDTSIDISDIYFGFTNDYTGGALMTYKWIINNGAFIQDSKNNFIDNVLCNQLVLYPRTEGTFNKLMQRFNIQLELGSTATTYEPYNGTTYNIQFTDGDNPLTVYGGTLDVTSGELVVDRKSVDLGSSIWAYTNGRFYYNPTNAKKYTLIEVPNMLCSQYSISQYASQADNSISSYAGYIYVRADSYNGDTTAFKTAMSGVQLVYELATPTTYQLTPTQVRTLVGNNNIWADTGDVLSGKYFKEL